MRSFKPGSLIRLSALIIVIFIVPIQLFCEGIVRHSEQHLILNLQQSNHFPESCQTKDAFCSRILQVPYMLFTPEATVFILFGLCLCADSWLTYKTALVTTVGLFYITFMQLCFKNGRPFWDQAQISSNGHCLYDFAGPSQNAFIMTFFWPYIQIMFLLKYREGPTNKLLNLFLSLMLLAFWAVFYLYSLLNGLSYIFQMVIG